MIDEHSGWGRLFAQTQIVCQGSVTYRLVVSRFISREKYTFEFFMTARM